MADAPVSAPKKKKSSISSRLVESASAAPLAAAKASRDASSRDIIAQQQSVTDFQGVGSGIDTVKDSSERRAMLQKTFDKKLSGLQGSVASSQANISAQNAKLADPESNITKPMTKDVLEGSRFGEAVLGDEGLGRAGDNADVQQGLNQLREQSKGFSGAESLARKEQALGGIATATQGQQRSLQSSLARAGVRGGAAGKQIGDVASQGIQSRANAEQQLLIQGEEAARAGTSKFIGAAGTLSSFDLGQAAKEKAIVLQSGLGFAQMGAAERGAKLQADASAAAAASSKQASGGGGLSVVCTELHRQGLITTKVWNNNTEVGKYTYENARYNYKGYLTWGLPIAKLMKKSKLATSILSPIMIPWVRHLGGESSVFNRAVYETLMVYTRFCGVCLFIKDTLCGTTAPRKEV